MYVVSDERLSGLMVAVITGGRPALKQRPTRRYLPDLIGSGIKPENIVWVVAEHHADEYERDDYPLAVYPTDWAYDYAREHWTAHDREPQRGGFLGAFPGREWACLEAERRGCWGVLQMDDNVIDMGVTNDSGYGATSLRRRGGLRYVVDMLAATALSTNSRMTGAQLGAVVGERQKIEKMKVFARTGFPYSVFIETVGEGREHWMGPFEDDITHAFQYGTGGAGYTAALLPWLKYTKESTSGSGMRKVYDHTRAVALQRMFPQSAKIIVKRAKSNGLGDPRVFHQMSNNAIRNPLRVTDRELFVAATKSAAEAVSEAAVLRREAIASKMAKRAAEV